ncbi:MAG: tRNA pseudouridine(55) synthase TruB [Flavobacteriales bacterium]|nr:tRNA pseudouridine(55) synthase TruB [Flavobacteriales bacterium]
MPPIKHFSDPDFSLDDILLGAVLLVDKPLGWTSFDVVNKLKYFARHELQLPKLKIGHAGTLDPLATGLLVVCTGKATKSIGQFQGGEKEYTGTIYLGQTTPSFDLETAPQGNFATGHITLEMLQEISQVFLGEHWQRPPIYSAKQVNGKRAYLAARAGEEMEMRPVQVTINEFTIVRFQVPHVDFRIRCSKGTYIRSIANDLGQKLGSGSYLSALRRTKSAPFGVDDANLPEDIMKRLKEISIARPLSNAYPS